MKPRPKYKVGDVIERWNIYPFASFAYYYLVVGIYVDHACALRHCKLCKRSSKVYNLKRVDTDNMIEYDVKIVDMLDWRYHFRCYKGWRKVA
jgi:hypothetical protein